MSLGRRRSLAAIACGLLAAPLAAWAQSVKKPWRIGYLGGGSRERLVHVVEALESGLRDLG